MASAAGSVRSTSAFPLGGAPCGRRRGRACRTACRAPRCSRSMRVSREQGPSSWEDASLVQLWGPRYQVYVVAARDLAVFSLGRLPDDVKGRRRAEDLAARLHAHLGGATMTYGEAGTALRVNPNSLRYAATTGTVLIRWAGARQPTVWTVPPAGLDPLEARLELARRHLHVFGPTTPEAFARWAGISVRAGVAAFASLRRSLTAVRTPTRRRLDPHPRRAAPPRRPGARRHRRGCCRAATPTTCSRETTARCSSRTPVIAARCGRPACGPAPCSSTARSAEPGGVRTTRSRSRPGAGLPARRATPSRRKLRPCRSPVSRGESSSAGSD